MQGSYYKNQKCLGNRRSTLFPWVYKEGLADCNFSVKLGAPEFVETLLTLSSLSDPLQSGPSGIVLSPHEVPLFLSDLAQFYESSEDELVAVLGPVIEGLLWYESLALPEGLGGADAGWRRIVGGMEALVSVKAIANMIPKLPSWNPPEATASSFEKISLMGPLMRLSVFSREWVCSFTSPSNDLAGMLKFYL